MAAENIKTRALFAQRAPDPVFLALKERLKSSDLSDTHISWRDVYDLKRENFAKNPELLKKITNALSIIETKPYGQELFKDIILNEDRVRPVDINASPIVPDFAPIAYLPYYDSISFHTSMMEKDTSSLFSEFLKNTSAGDLVSQLFHESDHAARTYGKQLPTEFIAKNLFLGCEEEHAMDRANLYNAEKGIPLWEEYWSIEQEIANMTNPTKELAEIKDLFKENGISERVRNSFLENFSILSLRSKGCGANITQKDSKLEVEQLMEQFLEATGLQLQKDLTKTVDFPEKFDFLPPAKTPQTSFER